MAKSQGNGANGEQEKREAQANAQAFLKALATPIADASTLDAMFATANSAVLVNVGTWVVPKRVPSDVGFAERVELAFQDTPVMKSDEDYDSLVSAIIAVHSPVSHDRRKFVYTEALRIAAETFINEQKAPVTSANIEAVVKQFRELRGEHLLKVAKRITNAINNGILTMRRDRRQTGEKTATAGLDLGKVLASL